MKKCFKKAVEILTKVAIMYIMLVSAQRCMNCVHLHFIWASIGYLVIFVIGLTMWVSYNYNKGE